MPHRECLACGLHKCASRLVFASGDPDGGIALVGEAPGPNEDREGAPFVGRAGRLLDEMLVEAGLSRPAVYVTNAVKCFPNVDGRIRAPDEGELRTCVERWLSPELSAVSPQVLVLMGATALKGALGSGSGASLSSLRGQIIETRWCRYTLVTYHPSYVLRSGGAGPARDAVVSDLRRARFLMESAAAGNGGERADVPAASTPVASAPAADGGRYGQLEQVIIEAPPWRPERRYFGGYSEGTDPVLLYRDERGEKQRELVQGFRWYFYMRTDDAVTVPMSTWLRWKSRGVFHGLEPDPVDPAWTKVYAKRAIVQTRWMRDNGEVGVVLNVLFGWEGAWTDSGSKSSFGTIRTGKDSALKGWASRREKFEADRLLGEFLEELHRYGPTYEADLSPRQRFMTDRFLHLEDQFNELFFDIETDDSTPGWKDKETWRFLSIAAVLRAPDGSVKRDCFVIRSETDAGERAMLRRFHDEFLVHADILYAWNGFNFDFPILRARMRLHGIDVDWRLYTWTDLLAVWRRYHSRGASAITTFALGELAPKVLHKEKLDWREESAVAGRRVNRIIDLYRAHPKILAQYNMRDADLLYELEETFGYAHVERVFCRLGNCFANDLHISTKIDMLLLNKGRSRGQHFVTRGLQHHVLPAYVKQLTSAEVRTIGDGTEVIETRGKHGSRVAFTGAFVKEPDVGYHEGVAALDFKSLYPTVMTLFNISPDSWVPRDRAADYPEKSITVTPSGACFRREPVGLVPLVFRETMEKRKVYTRLQLAEEVGTDRFLLYYRLSYAYKRLGLSFYGELGNESSRYFNPEVAEAVTLAGQWFIKKTIEFAESCGYRALYGDTDSLFIAMTEEQAKVFVKDCDAYYRGLLEGHFNVDMSRYMMELEYENYFKNIIFVRKKRYAGKMTMFKGKVSDVLEVKGLEMMRSDGIEYGRRVQRAIVDFILAKSRPPAARVIKRLLACRDEVFAGKLPVEDVTVTQSIEKDVTEYKTKPPHVRVAEHIRATSTEYFVGMKVPYIVVNEHPKIEAVWAREFVGQYDPYYVWNKKTYPLIERVLEVVYPDTDWLALYVERPKPAKRANAAPRAQGRRRKRAAALMA